MEVDERLRWLEARISSSLRPRGEEMRSLFSDEENRSAFLAFCNHSESRRLFVQLPEGEGGMMLVSPHPPRRLGEKSIVFLKCSHASKLSRESIGNDVVYSECSNLPLEHLELVAREVYLPLMAHGDKLLDLLHRLVAAVHVTRGLTEGRVLLPLPSITVLAESATSADHRATVIHVLESSVVQWMKQVKMAVHFDPVSSILKTHGKYAGPMAEIEFWTARLNRLEAVRAQLTSMVVLNVLHSLDRAQSTYSQAFQHVHRDIGKAIVDTELCLMYLSALQPWCLKLHEAYSPDTITRLFPPLMMTLLLIWQHSGFYSVSSSLYRLLRLLATEVMVKAKEIVGSDPLISPGESLVNLKQALRVCAAFRGCYLDYREKAEGIVRSQHEALQHGEEQAAGCSTTHTVPGPSSTWSIPSGPLQRTNLAPWPPRNSAVFGPLNAIMERCNDLLELVQTVLDFRELEAAAYGVGGAELGWVGLVDGADSDPLLADIHSEFTRCMQTFMQDSKDLLSLEAESSFEEKFFLFRSTVRLLERRLAAAVRHTFDQCPTLMAELRVLEMFKGMCQRDAVKEKLFGKFEGILLKLKEEVEAVGDVLASGIALPPSHAHTPPVSSKLLWLQALRERIRGPMEKLREISPELLEGEAGWKLRQTYGDVTSNIESHIAETEGSWTRSVPQGLARKLKDKVLTRGPSGILEVNLDPMLCEVLREARHLSRPPLGVHLPPAVRHLQRSVDTRELWERSGSLQAVVQTYNDLQDGLSDVDRLLFQHKLQQAESLLSTGLERLDWISAVFPDFIAKAKASISGDLHSTVATVHSHMSAVRGITQSWSLVQGLDMFGSAEEKTLHALQEKHSHLLESLHSLLPSSTEKIKSHIHSTLQCVEASPESPAWGAYLSSVDGEVVVGLKTMVLTAIGTLSHRAQQYEQGAHIPPLVTVRLELQGGDIQFSPPLSPHSPLPTVPEVVHRWMEGYSNTTRLVGRLLPGVEENYYSAIASDPDVRNAMSKICAHLETNARQCQSLRKRFTLYCFLWEQDVQATFQDFLCGQAAPHPRRFTRPETVRSRASARVLSGRPKSSSQSPSQGTLPVPEAPLLGVMGVSDWDFLRPPGMEPSEDEESLGKRPSLDDFDGEIAVFQGVLDRLSNIEDVADVGWLCVDQRPAKHALTSLAAKWKHVFAFYLEKQVAHVLDSLEVFFQEVAPEVEGISGEERDTSTFMRLMSTFNRVNAQQVEMDTKFGAVHRAVLMLDKFGHPLPPPVREQFSNAPQRWSNLKKRVALGKQRIGPRIQSKGDIISQDLSRFGEIFASLRGRFSCSPCLDHRCPREDVWTLIRGFRSELCVLQGQARDLIELQELLETSVFNFSLLKEYEEELSTLQETWNTAESVLSEHARWCRQSWQEVDCSGLLGTVGRQRDVMCSLPAVTHSWDVYQHTLEAIEIMQLMAPLVEGLRSSAMRPRHWKQVLRYATAGPSPLLGRGGAFDPALLEELTFGQLLSMGLHHHQAEVLAVVERAEKDVAIESLLNTFEEVWLSRQLQMRMHSRAERQEIFSDLGIDSDHSTPKSRAPSAHVTSAVRRGASYSVSVVSGGTPLAIVGEGRQRGIPLLYNTAGIFETLESHQTSLQSLVGTVAAASFTDDLQRWHKQLQTIEAVLGVWLDVQQLWVQMEEVYSSGEVQQQLPSPSFTFSSVDREWRALMIFTARNPAAMATCLKEGLLPSLEKLHSDLLLCRAALVRYVEGQRVRCPWFYFLSLEDILHFTCYASNPDQLSSLIPKLLPHAGRLTFDYSRPQTDHTHGHTHFQGGGRRISGVVSRLGEGMELTQPVLCEGPVESILTQLLTSVSSTVHTQLTNTVTKHLVARSTASHSHPQPALSNLPLVWNRPLATQVIVLATQITAELCLVKAVQESGKGNEQPLKELSKELDRLITIAIRNLKGKSLVGDRDDESAPSAQLPESYSDSSVLRSSTGNVPEGGEGSSGSGCEASMEERGGLCEGPERRRRGVVPRDHVHRMQNILLVLSVYKQRSKSLSKYLANPSSGNLSKSFLWKSMLHFDWLRQEQLFQLSVLDSTLPYGYHYTGSTSRIVLTPQTEKVMLFLLQAVRQGNNTLLTGAQGSGKCAVVHELAVSAGRPLFSLQCSHHVTHPTLLDCIRGMAVTGCWLLLRGLDQLPTAVLQATCDLLAEVQRARQSQTPSLHWRGEMVRVTFDNPSTCFASILVHPGQYSLQLTNAISDAFKTCSVPYPNQKLILKALFLVHEFESAVRLAKQLNALCEAFTELFGQNMASRLYLSRIETDSKPPEESTKGRCSTNVDPPPHPPLGLPRPPLELPRPPLELPRPPLELPRPPLELPRPPLGMQLLKGVVSLAQRYMREFEALGLIEAGGGGLHAPSTVYSEVSESTRASLRFKSTVMPASDDPAGNRLSLEEFSLVLAVKDSLLPSLPPSSPSLSTLIQLMADLFHNSCDIHGLLAYEEGVRGVLAERAKEDKSAAESARESRAASVMMTIQEDRQMSEVGSTLEDQVVHCCHLLQLSPSPPFQQAVMQFVSLVQLHPIVAIAGPSCSGKTECIQCGSEVMRGLCGAVGCVTLATEAMREEQLMGYQLSGENLWQEGLLPQLLAKHSSQDARPATQWIVLEGMPSSSQLDTLVSLLAPHLSLPLSNGSTISVDPSHHFILELPDLSCLTPSSAVKVPALCTSWATLTWRDVVSRWLSSDNHVKNHAATLMPLFDEHLPKILDFLAPTLRESEGMRGGGGGEGSVTSVDGGLLLEAQELQLSSVHVTITCCNILQSLLPANDTLSSVEVERCFIYAAVWGFGGFLTSSNKAIFESWWRNRATKLALPERGSLWDCYVRPGCPSFLKWSDDMPHYAAPVDCSSAPFVYTAQSAAVKHLVSVLIEGGFPVLLNGATGSGKTALLKQFLLQHCSPGVSDIGLLHIFTNHFTTAAVVWDQLRECLEWRWGRRHTPRGCRRLVCFIDDLHNTKSPTACELVRQHVASGGVYDPGNGKWHGVSDVCYLCTTHTTPRHQLRPQFMKHFAVVHWDGYSSDDLVQIFSTILRSHFATNRSPSPVQTDQSDDGTDPALQCRLVETAVQVHEKIRRMFLPTPERLHYLFTLRHLATVFRHLCMSCGHGTSSRDLLLLWQQESWWVYAGGLGSEVDRERYWEVVCHALRKFCSQQEELPTLLSKSSVRLPPQTVKDLRSRLSQEIEELQSTLHVNLYDNTVEEMWHMCHVICSPHDLGHMILLGHTHPEPLVHAAALHCGFTVVQPSQCFSPGLLQGASQWGMSTRSYGVEQLRRDLRAVYTSAGVRNEKLVLLLNTTELLHEEFLTCVYEFVKDGAISPLFSSEERSHIINTIRSDLTQAGLPFSYEAAWKFFTDRVSRNLRVMLAFPRLRDVTTSSSERWRELVGSMRVYCHLPWDKRQLVDTALHHLKVCQFLPAPQCENVAHLLASVHLQLSLTTTSDNTSYEYFVERFVHELQRTHSTISERCDQVTSALECVRLAVERGEALEQRVGRERVVLGEKCEACERLLIQVGQDTAISREHNKLVAKQRGRIAHLRKVIPDYQHACELAAQERDHIVQSSRHLVEGLDHGSLLELRALGHPSPDVEELLAAIITIVKGPSADHSWTKGAKRLMANLERFRELLLEFSACEDNSEVLLETLDPLLEKPSLSPGQLKSEEWGLAATQLCNWVQGVVRLHTTLQGKLRPLQAKVASMKASRCEYSEKLRHQERKVKVLQERMCGLTAALETASVEKSEQQKLVNSMSRELQETQEFITELTGVHQQWEEEVQRGGCVLHQSIRALTLTAVLATCLSHLPPHTQMEIINNQLKPTLEERGVGLEEKGVEMNWKPANPFMSMFCLSPCSSIQASIPHKNPSALQQDSATPEDPTAVNNLPVSETFPSYSHLSASILPFLVEESFVDVWLAEGYGVSQLLQLGLVETAWNRWPLVYDPEGCAASWIKQCKGEELVCLDATDRSSKFFLALDQALLGGQTVLIENVPAHHLDPALQPLVELGHTWDTTTGSKVIKFCGHQLHVPPSFHLYLTTTCPPHTIPSSLSTTTTLINCTASLPLTQELLLDSAYHLWYKQGSQELRESGEGVAKCRSKVTELEKELFEVVRMQGKEEMEYWRSAEKIARIMAAKNEVVTELNSHMENFESLLRSRSLLVPLAHHGALVHSLLHNLPYSLGKPHYQTSWESYQAVFTSALASHLHRTTVSELMAADTGEKRRDVVMGGVILEVNRAILQDSTRFLDCQDWALLAVSLILLAHCRPHFDTALLMDQLLYLSQSQSYLQELEVSNQFPPNPACVPDELWYNLHKLPLNVEYFRKVIRSTHSSPQFWEGLQKSHSEVVNFEAFPWREGEGDNNPITLNDFVLLCCINREAVVQMLQKEASALVESTSITTLAGILSPAASQQMKEPILFLSNERSGIANVNLYHLEAEVRSQLQGQSLQVLRMGAGLAGKASDLLMQPKSDGLLLMDVQHGPQEWTELLVWRLRHAVTTGCLLVLTASVEATRSLPPDLLRACRVVLLSNVAFSFAQSLPRSVWMRNKELPFHNLLQFLLASIPNTVMSQCSTLPEGLRPVLFGLVVLHTAVTSEETKTARHYLAASLCCLLASIQYLLSAAKGNSNPDIVIHSLQAYVKEIYSSCVAGERLDQLIGACLDHSSTGVSIALSENVQVKVPPSSMHPQQYVEHVKGSDASSSASPSPPAHVDTTSVCCVLPVLATIPGTDHEFTPFTSHPSPFSPTLVEVGKVREALETSLEQLPLPLPLRGADGARTGDLLDRALPICRKLPSAEQYRAFALYTAMCQFNSALSTIHRDVITLERYAAIGFDSLPREMVPILEGVWRGKMPLEWCQGVCGELLSLKDGMTVLQQLSTLLRTLFT